MDKNQVNVNQLGSTLDLNNIERCKKFAFELELLCNRYNLKLPMCYLVDAGSNKHLINLISNGDDVTDIANWLLDMNKQVLSLLEKQGYNLSPLNHLKK